MKHVTRMPTNNRFLNIPFILHAFYRHRLSVCFWLSIHLVSWPVGQCSVWSYWDWRSAEGLSPHLWSVAREVNPYISVSLSLSFTVWNLHNTLHTHTCIIVYTILYIYEYKYWHADMHKCLCTHRYIHTCLHAYINACICRPTYMLHPHVHTYKHPYLYRLYICVHVKYIYV